MASEGKGSTILQRKPSPITKIIDLSLCHIDEEWIAEDLGIIKGAEESKKGKQVLSKWLKMIVWEDAALEAGEEEYINVFGN